MRQPVADPPVEPLASFLEMVHKHFEIVVYCSKCDCDPVEGVGDLFSGIGQSDRRVAWSCDALRAVWTNCSWHGGSPLLLKIAEVAP